MADILDEDMLGDILKSSPSQYFFHKEEDGEVEVLFETPISITEPGDEDIMGRVWNPPIVDANGNPLLDFNGEPRQPWAKVEAKVFINGAPHIYAFGGKTSSCLKAIIQQMNANSIKNSDLPGTKWSINRTGKWNWIISYIGEEALPASTPAPTKTDNKVKVIKDALSGIKLKNPSIEDGIDKSKLIYTITFLSGLTEKDVEECWKDLIVSNVIKEVGDKVFVN